MISVVLLSHNDEEILARAISSVSWADEVIVVDDASSDTTVEIAKKSGATVIIHPLEKDFATQRNIGLQKAKDEWVFFLDSDEVVSTELKNEILSIVNTIGGASEIVGYFIKRTDHMWGKALMHGETSDVRLLRLAKKGSGLWSRPVHEIWEIVGKTSELHCPLDHFPHPTVAQFLHEINMYSTINADMLYANKTPAKGWHIIAYPKAKFIKNYIVLGGFRDGMPGVLVAIMMSLHSFLTRGKLYMHYHAKRVPLP